MTLKKILSKSIFLFGGKPEGTHADQMFVPWLYQLEGAPASLSSQRREA